MTAVPQSGGLGLIAIVAARLGVLSNVLYNTGTVKPADAPKSYKDLLDPKWRGRIAMPRSPGPWVNLSYALGEEETARVLDALIHQQEARLLPTYPDVKARVISGEFPLGLGPDVFVEAAQGAPVANADLHETALAPWAFALVKDARHPALAKLWGYWAVSREGQQLSIICTASRSHLLPGLTSRNTPRGRLSKSRRSTTRPRIPPG